MNHICRKYRSADLVNLQGLMFELGYSVELKELSNNISEIQKKGGELFIAEKNSATIGSVCVLIDARLAEGVYAEIVSLVVSEKTRGQGVGKDLVAVAEAWASRRVRKIRVRANVARTAAHAFYRRQGYQEIKTQKIFKKTV